MQSTFLGAVVNLTVCMVTVSHMGIRGAALSNLLAELAVHIYLVVSFEWHVGLSVLRDAIRPVLAGSGAYAISIAMRASGPLFCAALTAASFLGLLLLIGGLTTRDLNRLRALIPVRRWVAETPS